ncbi:hypothetical protein HDA32_001418 [Spinactinospora alkalitolerans]|uniref:Uncharacterized protein n=1 Tax=Spinactinospora alkalitolerans TaxID=687207 RepID=A0A852TQR4_9ACTN|nr:hypothetical protein [Spinactinospora alkalitolerans]NYE46298.1 hypothetical protein [Spinactinospora alkalitolerans]
MTWWLLAGLSPPRPPVRCPPPPGQVDGTIDSAEVVSELREDRF